MSKTRRNQLSLLHTLSRPRTLVFGKRHSLIGPRMREGPLFSSVGIPRGPVSMFLTATNPEANAPSLIRYLTLFFVDPSLFLAAIHTCTLYTCIVVSCMLREYHLFWLSTFFYSCLPLLTSSWTKEDFNGYNQKNTE